MRYARTIVRHRRQKLSSCPPGLFLYKGCLCLKTQYASCGYNECYICDNGEAFWGGTNNFDERDKLVVTVVTLN